MTEEDAAQARALLGAGRLREARDAALHALRADPQDNASRFVLAHALFGLGDDDAAFDHAAAIVAEEPDFTAALRLLAYAAGRSGRPRQGLDAANEALRQEPNDWQSHAVVAYAEARANGRRGAARAIAAGQAAIELAPDVAGAHQALGTAYLLLGRPRQAEAALRQALALDPNDPQIRQNLGVALERRFRFAGALNQFAGLTGEQPANPVHTRNIAATFGRGIALLLLLSAVWVMIVLRVPPPEPASDGTPSPLAFVYGLALPITAAIAVALFLLRFHYRFGALISLVRREDVRHLRAAAVMVIVFAVLFVAAFFSGDTRMFIVLGAVVVLAVATIFAFPEAWRNRAKRRGEAPREEPRPLTFREDVLRTVRHEPAPRRLDGKPVIQPWAVGPGRIIGFVCAVLSFVPLFGVMFGLLGFVLSNTAWAHLRNAGLPRRLPLCGQILSAVGTVLGVAFIVVLVTIPHV